MTTMLLKNLIDNLNSKISNLKIRKISADSRKIQKGDLFVSIRGNKFDGNKFIHKGTFISDSLLTIINQD